MIPAHVEVVCLAFGDRYKDLYLTRMFNMLSRHMPRPFTLTIVTDRPRSLPPEIRTIDASGWRMTREGMRPTTNKLRLFDPALFGPERFPDGFLYLDTTLVIQKDLTSLLDYAFGQEEELVVVDDWNYECYNTCTMRIRGGGDLSVIYDAWLAGEEYERNVNGDQDFVYAVVVNRGLQHRVALFREDDVVSYRNARELSRIDLEAAHAMLGRGTIVKFFGYLKMHQVANAWWRWKRARKHPEERAVLGFWAKELRARWR